MLEFDVDALKKACSEAIPEAEHSGLLDKIHQVLPDYSFVPVLTRSGWYRNGGVVDSDNKFISDDLGEWANSVFDGDIESLYDSYADKGLKVTRKNGKTHYLIFETGDRPQDFIQLEVEEIVEVVDRILFADDEMVDILEELIDPPVYDKLEPEIVRPARYLFRRIIPIADYLDKLDAEVDIKPPILRFIRDWKNSSAAESAIFCHKWVLAFREYVDGYGEQRFHAKPITTYSGEIPIISGNVPRGAELANLIHSFDRKVGYPMAWYFFMLSHKQISHEIAESIHKDLMGAYDYLPIKDVKLLESWYDRPYGV